MKTPPGISPVGDLLREEMEARGWSLIDLQRRCGSMDPVDWIALRVLYECEGESAKGLRLDEHTAKLLEKAIGASADMWLNYDAAYHMGTE